MKRKLILSLILVIVLLASGACSGGSSAGADSPALIAAEIVTEPASSEDSQFVQVELRFDKEIAIHPDKMDSLRITIAGNRVKDASIEAGEDPESAVLILPTSAVTNGIVHVERAETAKAVTAVTDSSGGSPVADFTIEGTTPSGVTLSTVTQEPGETVMQVDSPWNIRSIAWVGLFDNGEMVAASETRPGETLDGYAAVHGHEFLTEREADIAEKITETLRNNYGGSYRFNCDGSRITVSKEGSDSMLDVRIYQYIDYKNSEK